MANIIHHDEAPVATGKGKRSRKAASTEPPAETPPAAEDPPEGDASAEPAESDPWSEAASDVSGDEPA